MPRLYGLPWRPAILPWGTTELCCKALEPCFTRLFYSNLYTELSTLIDQMRQFRKCYFKKKYCTLIRDYLPEAQGDPKTDTNLNLERFSVLSFDAQFQSTTPNTTFTYSPSCPPVCSTSPGYLMLRETFCWKVAPMSNGRWSVLCEPFASWILVKFPILGRTTMISQIPT